jgi:hypothetical protein
VGKVALAVAVGRVIHFSWSGTRRPLPDCERWLGELVQTRANRAPRLQDRCKFPPMTARGRFVARLVTMLIALAGFVTVGALPAAAGNSGTVQYIALGDSYAAGQGGGD